MLLLLVNTPELLLLAHTGFNILLAHEPDLRSLYNEA